MATTFDVCQLCAIEELSVVNLLESRYKQDDIYTFCGQEVLLAVNPCRQVEHLYSEAVLSRYSCSDCINYPVHLYSIASAAYTRLRDSDETVSQHVNENIIVCGDSGAGKTESTKHVMRFLAEMSLKSEGTRGVPLPALGRSHFDLEAILLDSNPLLEAFGNAATCRNSNSSRFGKFVDVLFNPGGVLLGACLKTFLLEKNRVLNVESGFHVFYHLGAALKTGCLATVDEMLQRYPGVKEILLEQLSRDQDDLDYQGWMILTRWLDETLSGVSCDSLSQLLVAMVLLRMIEFVEVEEGVADVRMEDDALLECVCGLLKVSKDGFLSLFTRREIVSGGHRRRTVFEKPCSAAEAAGRRDSITKWLYEALFHWLVDRINASLSPSNSNRNESRRSLGLLDMYGFESLQCNSLEQLCINYANERLQAHFTEIMVRSTVEEYSSEGLCLSELADTAVTQHEDSVGGAGAVEQVFSLLAEEARLNRRGPLLSGCSSLASKLGASHLGVFTIRHYAGPVEYTVDGLKEKDADLVPPELLRLLRRDAVVSDVASLLQQLLRWAPPDPVAPGGSPARRRTVATKFRDDVSQLLQTLRRGRTQWVRCLRPGAGARWCSSTVTEQLRAAGVVEAARVARQVHPVRMLYSTLLCRYRPLLNYQSSQAEPLQDQEEELERSYRAHRGLHDTPGTPGRSRPRRVTPRRALRRRTGASCEDHSRRLTAALLAGALRSDPVSVRQQLGRCKAFLTQSQADRLEDQLLQCRVAAAVKLQAVWRGHRVRKQLKTVVLAAVTLQSAWRGLRARRRVKNLINEERKRLYSNSKTRPVAAVTPTRRQQEPLDKETPGTLPKTDCSKVLQLDSHQKILFYGRQYASVRRPLTALPSYLFRPRRAALVQLLLPHAANRPARYKRPSPLKCDTAGGIADCL